MFILLFTELLILDRICWVLSGCVHWGCNFLHLIILHHSPNIIIAQILVIKKIVFIYHEFKYCYLISQGVFFDLWLHFLTQLFAFPVLHSCLDFFFCNLLCFVLPLIIFFQILPQICETIRFLNTQNTSSNLLVPFFFPGHATPHAGS